MIQPRKDGLVAKRLIVEGQVQGVGFRHWLILQAVTLGLDGWVRNREEGFVEAVLLGPEERVKAMMKLCYKGPELSRVTSVRSAPYRQGANQPEVVKGYGFKARDTL
jgi:acylphosphatase